LRVSLREAEMPPFFMRSCGTVVYT
jgi:hypothetical protein